MIGLTNSIRLGLVGLLMAGVMAGGASAQWGQGGPQGRHKALQEWVVLVAPVAREVWGYHCVSSI